ncbi:LPO_1073/Vpar_1526 family protein [Providencia sp. PROV209]|uniref:LPO_1073/Vpar_1526 family protein n=1 Tax=Providencia sp. PROV209 TaxID=2949906 RepID=UPI00234989D6|nr:LPO_1073/Vpar_1526 family protein [Providencia sp. PROV209]
MSLLDKNNQQVGDNSTSLQAGGNITINFGTGEDAIRDIVARTLQFQMPALREEAKRQVDEIASSFGSQIIERLSQEAEAVVIEKLRSPDIQYQINQSVIQVARKGFGIKSNILKELIADKISSHEEEEDILIDHAFEIMPRLTTDNLKLISIIHFIRSFSSHNFFKIKYVKSLLNNKQLFYRGSTIYLNSDNLFYHLVQGDSAFIHSIVYDIESLKKVDLSMMAINGCIDFDKRYNTTYIDVFKRFNPAIDIDESNISTVYSTLNSIINKFGIDDFNKLNGVTLTPLGAIIATCYLESLAY